MFLMVFIPRCLHPPAHPGAAQAHRTTPPDGLEQQTKELGFPVTAEAACSYPQWDAVWSLLLELEFPPNTPGVPGKHRGSWRTHSCTGCMLGSGFQGTTWFGDQGPGGSKDVKDKTKPRRVSAGFWHAPS